MTSDPKSQGRRRCRHAHAERGQGGGLLCGPVPDRDTVANLLRALRNRGAHFACAKNPDPHGASVHTNPSSQQ